MSDKEEVRKSIRKNYSEIEIKGSLGGCEIISSWVPDKNIEDYVASFIIEAIK